jgi:hypothetical protein
MLVKFCRSPAADYILSDTPFSGADGSETQWPAEQRKVTKAHVMMTRSLRSFVDLLAVTRIAAQSNLTPSPESRSFIVGNVRRRGQ